MLEKLLWSWLGMKTNSILGTNYLGMTWQCWLFHIRTLYTNTMYTEVNIVDKKKWWLQSLGLHQYWPWVSIQFSIRSSWWDSILCVVLTIDLTDLPDRPNLWGRGALMIVLYSRAPAVTRRNMISPSPETVACHEYGWRRRVSLTWTDTHVHM